MSVKNNSYPADAVTRKDYIIVYHSTWYNRIKRIQRNNQLFKAAYIEADTLEGYIFHAYYEIPLKFLKLYDVMQRVWTFSRRTNKEKVTKGNLIGLHL